MSRRARLKSRGARLMSHRARLMSRRARLKSHRARLKSHRARLMSRRARLKSRRARLKSRGARLKSRGVGLKPQNASLGPAVRASGHGGPSLDETSVDRAAGSTSDVWRAAARVASRRGSLPRESGLVIGSEPQLPRRLNLLSWLSPRPARRSAPQARCATRLSCLQFHEARQGVGMYRRQQYTKYEFSCARPTSHARVPAVRLTHSWRGSAMADPKWATEDVIVKSGEQGDLLRGEYGRLPAPTNPDVVKRAPVHRQRRYDRLSRLLPLHSGPTRLIRYRCFAHLAAVLSVIAWILAD
jgi:hypothetical protein